MDFSDIVHQEFIKRVTLGDFPHGSDTKGPLSHAEAIDIFRAQCLSRNLDIRSRKMKSVGQGYYTIGS